MFVTFEGIDGSGKTTQITRLAQRLRRAGRTVQTLREPGGTRVSEQIRALLLDPDLDIVPVAEMLLFSAARAQIVTKAVRPALAAGDVVLCDRFYDSTTAYQGAGRGLGALDWMTSFHTWVTGGLAPDRTYWIDLPLDAARSRLTRRGGANTAEPDRMEQADAAFYERVAAGYAELAHAESERIVRLDGTLSPDTLHEQIWADLQPLLSRSPEGARGTG